MRARRGFTLIELLTVIAISAVLTTIIVVPVIDSFNFLRAGLGFSEAQERARLLLDKISREISNSAGVRDNSGLGGQIEVLVPSGAGSPDPVVPVLLSNAKLDIYMPAEGEPQVDAAGNPVYVDPVTGKIDPTLKAPKGQVVLPTGAGQTLVRYFIGLRDPFLNAPGPNEAGLYNNPYDGLLMPRGGGRDNLYVLYRAEVQPYIFSGGSYIPNAAYFATDATGKIVLDDPAFFVPDGTVAKANRIANWLKASTVQTEVSRYDMVMPSYNQYSHLVVYDRLPSGDLVPRLVPLLQFKPTKVSNEPARQMRPVRLGEESDNSALSGADVIRTQYGGWSNPFVRTYPYPLSGLVNPQTDPYLVGRYGKRSDGSVGLSIYGFDPTTGGDDQTGGSELFDVTAYEASVSGGSIAFALPKYAFSAGVLAADNRSGWVADDQLRALFAPYDEDASGGRLLAGFNISDVGLNPLRPTPTDPLGTRPNLPHGNSGTETTYLTSSGAGASWAGPTYTINDAFNLAWNTYPELRPNIQRYIDLRVTPNEDGTYGPLFPDSSINFASANVVVKGNARSFARAAIVPGTETVWGPNQLPGPNYGLEVRYTRTTGEPGPNQYRLNYVRQPQPNDFTLLGLTPADLAGFDPNVYDPTNFVSAAIQARYMPGYLQLDSDPNVPLPNTTPFKVFYRFAFTTPQDSFAVDYDSRQVMSLLLTIRNYPQTTLPNPQSVTLKTTATVRNFLR